MAIERYTLNLNAVDCFFITCLPSTKQFTAFFRIMINQLKFYLSEYSLSSLAEVFLKMSGKKKATIMAAFHINHIILGIHRTANLYDLATNIRR